MKFLRRNSVGSTFELPRRGLHQPFDHEARFGPAGAAIGIDRRGVGVDADHLGEDVGNVVLARQQRRVEIGRHRRREQRHVGAEIGVGLDPQADDLVVLVKGDLGLGQMIAAVGVGEKGLGPVAGPLHRPTGALGGPQCHHFFRIDEDLGAEAAADIRRDDPQFVLLGDVVERRQHQARDVRILRGGVEREMLFRGIVFGDRRARLHRVRHQPVVGDVERGHMGCALERGFRCGLVPDGPVVNDVIGCLRVKLRRAVRHRVAHIDHRRQFLIVDDDGFGGIAGLVARFGDHDRDGLADKAHGLRRHRRPRAHLHRRAVLGMDHPAADQVADLVIDDLPAGQHADHARHLHRFGAVDALHPGMGMRAADERGIGHAMQADVIHIAALAGDETLVFLANDPCADAFDSHDVISLSRLLRANLSGASATT